MGGLGGAAALMGVEICAPLLLLCWLCCWPDDSNSDASSDKHPKRPVVTSESGRRSSEVFSRRFGSSAVSLHLPTTSGFKKQPLSAHRSHEEIRSRRKSHHESREDTARYHSAPSVIDEVLHRRDWERSTRDLYIPLRPEAVLTPHSAPGGHFAQNGTSFEHRSDEEIVGRPCKKHHTNIKSSRNKKKPETMETSYKELTAEDIKDEDVTEQTPGMSNFYIGDASCMLNKENIEFKVRNIEDKRTGKAKDVKQSMNESIKYRERPRNILGPLTECQASGVFSMEEMEPDRSGAVHHLHASRSSYCDTPSLPQSPPAAEAVRVLASEASSGNSRCAVRARHASAGDVLAPLLRPHSAALSESDLDYELECCDEPPPAYDELQVLAIAQRKETAI